MQVLYFIILIISFMYIVLYKKKESIYLIKKRL